MADKLTRDGVELMVMGFDKFIADLDKSGLKWDETVNRFRDGSGKLAKTTDVGPAFEKMRGYMAASRDALASLSQEAPKTSSGLLDFGKNVLLGAGQSAGLNTAITALTGGVGALGIAVGSAAVNIGKKFVTAVKEATAALQQFFVESLHVAGEYEEMEYTALAVGQAMGLSRDTIEGASGALQDLGVRADVANKAVAQLARNNLDLASSTDLVRIAQATGIIMQRDSSEELDALIHAAISQSTVMLRQRGIFIDNELALKKYADTLGKTTEELTQSEQAQARVNAIIENGQRVLGVYDAAMKSPTKQLRSLSGREIPALKAALGAPFLDAWAGAIGIVRDFVGRLTDAISEGGSLYPILVNLGAAASMFVDGLRSGYDAVISFVEGLEVDLGGGIMDIVSSAFRWGAEIVGALAEGMVRAYTTTLTYAMNRISEFLTYWLSPGSPPRVAPDLDKWGMSAMTTYLEGMTSADFDVLEKIQGPLQNILEGPEFADISKSLAQALAGGDRKSFLDIVSGATEMFGQEVAQVAEKQFALADATDAVRVAEEQLAETRDRFNASQKKVVDLTEQYNTMLRQGASRQELDAQLKLINAAEKQRDLAADQIGGAEAAVDIAKKREDAAKEELSLQERLLNQLMGINTALVENEKEKMPKGAKEKLFPEDVLPEPTEFDLTSKIGSAIEDAKEALKGKFADLFSPLTDAIANVKEDWKDFTDSIDGFVTDITGAWDRMKEKYTIFQDLEDLLLSIPEKVEDVKEAFSPLLSDAWQKIVSFWEEDLKPTFDSLGELLNTIVSKALETLAEKFDLNLTNATSLWEFIKEKFVPDWETVLDGALTWSIEHVFNPLATGLDSIGKALEGVRDWFDRLAEAIRNLDVSKILMFLGHSPSPLERGLRGINDAMQELTTVHFPALNQEMSMIPTMGSVPGPSPTYRGTGGPITTNNTFQFGGNTISNGMSLAQFEAHVVRVIRREMSAP